jgi:hypothetical protein
MPFNQITGHLFEFNKENVLVRRPLAPKLPFTSQNVQVYTSASTNNIISNQHSNNAAGIRADKCTFYFDLDDIALAPKLTRYAHLIGAVNNNPTNNRPVRPFWTKTSPIWLPIKPAAFQKIMLEAANAALKYGI